MIEYQLASAGTLNLPVRPDIFEITGTTTISTINGGYAGRIIILSFTAACTTDEAGNIRLDAALGNFAGGALGTLVLKWYQTASLWVEISRKSI
jgi:hypothetical protein